MKVSRIDLSPVGGVAGDMFAAALLHALPELREPAQRDISNLGIDGLTASTEPTTSASLLGWRFVVTQPDTPKPPRTLAQVEQFLKDSNLSEDVTDVAIGIYALLAKAEAAVHGKTIETIHFHEVSDWDSMVDIVTAAGIIARLPAVNWRLGPLPLGSGTVKTAHGDIPVPAPATVQLLEGFEWFDDGVGGERVTPTGAAIVKYLKPGPTNQSVASALLHATGSGAGTRELPGRANILRATVFTEVSEAVDETIESLAFEVDDMTGEEIGVATDRLRDLEGVLDISLQAMQGKKNRPATGFRILTRPDQAEPVMRQCFEQTTTLGIRRNGVTRRVLDRHEQNSADIAVKVAKRSQYFNSAKAENDHLLNANNLTQRRAMAVNAERDAVAKLAQQNKK